MSQTKFSCLATKLRSGLRISNPRQLEAGRQPSRVRQWQPHAFDARGLCKLTGAHLRDRLWLFLMKSELSLQPL